MFFLCVGLGTGFGGAFRAYSRAPKCFVCIVSVYDCKGRSCLQFFRNNCQLSAPSVAIFLRLRLRFSDAGEKIAATFCGTQSALGPPESHAPRGAGQRPHCAGVSRVWDSRCWHPKKCSMLLAFKGSCCE